MQQDSEHKHTNQSTTERLTEEKKSNWNGPVPEMLGQDIKTVMHKQISMKLNETISP